LGVELGLGLGFAQVGCVGGGSVGTMYIIIVYKNIIINIRRITTFIVKKGSIVNIKGTIIRFV
jgi:hypothetical protein